ncbi:MAG: beta-1,6-N-acetylglucosaminyltransferase [Candidatus Pedobacter colombiensis]|uniref:Peptide O-xylosyltransferase n=1 Tax=Candidatus Pedobacter colombiensis TaxID=3121371 RepID=A0AAJ5WAU7_9SPHI|nr:beta-1,6-N-acetylglucosaminyltransferase [Pedobacter sp.]WEK21216.1 MAG: beta-1,6-N-acetylglucosaminyltransferase [Pedobacter sp.]
MRIAHIIIAHKNPIQLERLIRKMQYPKFDFYIHIDKKVDIQNFLHLKDITRVFFIENRIVCNWGGYSTLQAIMNSLEEVHKNNVQYGCYNLLSAQDYPLKANSKIYDFLLKNEDKSFIYYEVDGSQSDWWKSAVQRFQKYHLTDFNFTGKFLVEKIINMLLPKRKFPLPLKLYGGAKACWWTINNECAAYLIMVLKKNNKFNSFLKFCWGTDEFVIPTMLMNSHLTDKIVNDNLRYIEFPKGKANPKILVSDDINDLLRSDMLFARKFDIEVDPNILDKIDIDSQ